MTDDRGRHAGPDDAAGGEAAGDAADAEGPLHRVDVDGAPRGVDGAASEDRQRPGPPEGVGAEGGRLAGAHPASVDREFDWRGWVLVGAILVSFLVIPGLILLYPHLGPRLGLTFWDTYLALPLIPAVVLALLAVWATTRP